MTTAPRHGTRVTALQQRGSPGGAAGEPRLSRDLVKKSQSGNSFLARAIHKSLELNVAAAAAENSPAAPKPRTRSDLAPLSTLWESSQNQDGLVWGGETCITPRPQPTSWTRRWPQGPTWQRHRTPRHKGQRVNEEERSFVTPQNRVTCHDASSILVLLTFLINS